MSTNKDLKQWQISSKEFDKQVNTSKFGTSLEIEEEIPYIKSLIKKNKGTNIVELGCGAGDFSNDLKEMGFNIKSVDGSSDHVIKAKNSFPTIEFQQQDISEKIKFKDNEFDIAVSRFVLMYIENLEKLSREVHRILKPSGQFVFSVIHPVYPFIYKLLEEKSRYRNFKSYIKTSRGSIKMGEAMYPYYFRPIEAYINPFIKNGFNLLSIKEIVPKESFVKSHPNLERMKGKPVYLILQFGSK